MNLANPYESAPKPPTTGRYAPKRPSDYPHSNPQSPEAVRDSPSRTRMEASYARQSELQQLTVAYQQALSKLSRRAWIHGGICVLGLILTFATLESAQDSGDTYVVFWGAIIFGAINCIRYAIQYSRTAADRDKMTSATSNSTSRR